MKVSHATMSEVERPILIVKHVSEELPPEGASVIIRVITSLLDEPPKFMWIPVERLGEYMLEEEGARWEFDEFDWWAIEKLAP